MTVDNVRATATLLSVIEHRTGIMAVSQIKEPNH